MRRLAAPFLMTASMAAPAVAQPAPIGPAKPRVRVFRNPPRPKRPRPIKRPAPPVTQVEVADGTIRRGADGQCRKFVKMNCPPQAKCNPPPPQVVACPAVMLPLPAPDDSVIRHPDGTCEAVASVKCFPGETCNPPAPRPVRCPPSKTPASQPASGTFAPPPPSK